jgi:hypothetical protein
MMQKKHTSAFALLLALLLGCGSKTAPLPELHAVKGRVVKGGQPVVGGFLQLQRDNDPSVLVINAPVGEDGSFVVTTIGPDGKQSPGAPEGNYHVTYTKPGSDQNVVAVTLPHLLKIDAASTELLVDLSKVGR